MTSDIVPDTNITPQPQNQSTISTVLSQQPLINVSNSKRDYNQLIYNKLKYVKNVKISPACLGAIQILFGFLMATFGILVIINKSELAQLGAGLWGSSFAFASGIAGLIASSKKKSPSSNGGQKLVNTIFLAFTLISIATSQLVLVIASIGLARDMDKENQTEEERKAIDGNSMVLLSNVGLIIVSGLECLCAIIISYKCSKTVCPCFDKQSNVSEQQIVNTKEILLNSWLGKHHFQAGTPPPMYVVAPPSTIDRRNRHPTVMPIAPITRLLPPLMGYPLIPAPLGSIPSPKIWPHSQTKMAKHYSHRKRRSNDHGTQKVISMKQKPSKQTPRKRQITTEEVINSYTGLDRIIAEEFIEICDSQSNLLSSLSGQSSIQSTCNGGSEVNPKEGPT